MSKPAKRIGKVNLGIIQADEFNKVFAQLSKPRLCDIKKCRRKSWLMLGIVGAPVLRLCHVHAPEDKPNTVTFKDYK